MRFRVSAAKGYSVPSFFFRRAYEKLRPAIDIKRHGT